MLQLLLSPDYAIFSVALIIMIGIGVIEAIGFGLGNFDFDADVNGDLDTSSLLGWLGLKSGLPILIWLVSFLCCFTVIGFATQQIATSLFGAPIHWTGAAGISLLLGLVCNSRITQGLAKLMPEYESTAIETDDLIMRRAVILEGTSRRGHPARAKVIDQHGQAHYLMVEPQHDTDAIAQGESALLVRRDGPTFYIQPDIDTRFRPL